MFQKRFLTIPVIDFSRFLKGSIQDKKIVSQEIISAFKNCGFIYLSNHPIANVDEAFAQSKKFFELPMQEKLKLSWVSPEANRGYVSPGREKVTQLKDKNDVEALRKSSPDIKESLEIGKEPSTTYQNNWPNDPEFKYFMNSFFEQCHAFHLQVMDSIGLGLGLKSGYFNSFCDKRDHNLRLLHYPSVSKSIMTGDQARAGAHTDYGTLTLLFQDSRGGLQVKSPEGEWINATPIPGTIVVNAGDLLSRWSNDVIKSTDHRVVSPEIVQDVYPDRYSIAFFCNPNWDAQIECIEECTSPSQPAKYEGINTHQYLVQRLSATY